MVMPWYLIIEQQQKIVSYLSGIDAKIESVSHLISQTQVLKRAVAANVCVETSLRVQRGNLMKGRRVKQIASAKVPRNDETEARNDRNKR
jgi:hypothetical protein